jgi:hypothetical protein
MLNRKSKVSHVKVVDRYADARKLSATSDIYLRDSGRVVLNNALVALVAENLQEIFAQRDKEIKLTFKTDRGIAGLINRSKVIGYKRIDLTHKLRRINHINNETNIGAIIINTAEIVNIVIVSNGRYVLKDNDRKVLRYLQIDRLDISDIDTSLLTNASLMFQYASRLKYVNMSNLNFKYVKSCSSMFAQCTKLEGVNFNGVEFSINKVEDISGMFNNCAELKTVNISNMKSNSIKYMNSIFNNCRKLTHVDMSGIDTTNCCRFQKAFNDCINLNNIKLGKLDFSSDVNMAYMFYNCDSLTMDTFKTNDLLNHYYEDNSLELKPECVDRENKRYTIQNISEFMSLNNMTPLKLNILRNMVSNGIIGPRTVYRAWVESFYYEKLEYRNTGLTRENLDKYYMQLVTEIISCKGVMKTGLSGRITFKSLCINEFLYTDAVLKLVTGVGLIEHSKFKRKALEK